MRVVLVSKALVVGAYQRKAEEIARLGVDLTVFTPPVWSDRRGRQILERRHTNGYRLEALPIRFNGNFHLHYYPTLAHELIRLRPDVLHMDEEPYNLATWLALRAAARAGSAAIFFTWQNLYRRYPPPFSWWEQANYRRAALAIAGNREAAAVLQRKGFTGPITVLPQFGVDPAIFAPGSDNDRDRAQLSPFCIGYAGGLIPEKGVDLLLAACAGLEGDWRLHVVGDGAMRETLVAQAQALGNRVRIESRLPSHAMPDFYRTLDVLVVPSHTTARWKEQFGRVLIEAMACGVPVVGSDSGEIPHVIDEAGLIFPEGDVAALRNALQTLMDAPDHRQALAQAGRTRVLANFTMSHIATQTVTLYKRAIS